MNVIFGAGGFAKEVGWLLHDLAKHDETVGPTNAFVVSDDAPNIGQLVHGVPVVSESEFFRLHRNTPLNAYLAVGSPWLKQRLHEKCLASLHAASFPALVHPSVLRDTRPGAINFGSGVIVCAGTIITTDVKIGGFVHLNLNCTIGHDSVIGPYSTLSPGVHVSGRVRLGQNCFVGTGAVLLENIDVTAGSTIGAGATATKTLTQRGTYVGTPARLQQ